MDRSKEQLHLSKVRLILAACLKKFFYEVAQTQVRFLLWKYMNTLEKMVNLSVCHFSSIHLKQNNFSLFFLYLCIRDIKAVVTQVSPFPASWRFPAFSESMSECCSVQSLLTRNVDSPYVLPPHVKIRLWQSAVSLGRPCSAKYRTDWGDWYCSSCCPVIYWRALLLKHWPDIFMLVSY